MMSWYGKTFLITAQLWGKSPATNWPEMRSFGAFHDVCINKMLNKPSRRSFPWYLHVRHHYKRDCIMHNRGTCLIMWNATFKTNIIYLSLFWCWRWNPCKRNAIYMVKDTDIWGKFEQTLHRFGPSSGCIYSSQVKIAHCDRKMTMSGADSACFVLHESGLPCSIHILFHELFFSEGCWVWNIRTRNVIVTIDCFDKRVFYLFANTSKYSWKSFDTFGGIVYL